MFINNTRSVVPKKKEVEYMNGIKISFHMACVAIILCRVGAPVYARQFTSGTAFVIVGPSTITQPGVYQLGNDIVGTVTIAASNVTLDLNNKRLGGASVDVGIYCTNQTDVIIQNGILQNSNQHVLISTCTNVTIEDVDFIGGQTGVLFEAVESGAIDNCSLRQLNSSGIFLQTCSLIQCTNLEFYENTVSSVLTCSFSNAVIFDTIEVAHNTFNQNLNVPEFLPQIYVASIFVTNSNDVLINKCSLTNNNFYTNNNFIMFLPICGIEVFKSDARIQTFVFSNNSATVEVDNSGPFVAINIDFAVTAAIDGLVFNNNNALFLSGNGVVGAVTVNSYSDYPSAINTEQLTIANCSCTNNNLQPTGNIICYQLSRINNCVIYNSTITNNSFMQFGIYADSVDTVAIRSCYIAENTNIVHKGLVGVRFSSGLTGVRATNINNTIIGNCIVANNTAASGHFFGLDVSETAVVTIENNIIQDNTASVHLLLVSI